MTDVKALTEKEFKELILKKNEPKKYRVTNSWGVYDAYKLIRKHKWYDIGRPLKEHEFYSIIRKVNDYLVKSLLEGDIITLPCRMGNMSIHKKEPETKIVDGKLKISNPIDWDATLSLWFNDDEARKNKLLVRHRSRFFYQIRYSKYNANYENKGFYSMVINRFIKRALKEKVQKGQFETLW